ncbi:MAG: peptide chain release factor N(5)-glutamine methyltransferase, partial [Rhodobacteraceae bacterium]|nr:peptide chain release factor N(5)-glutamine methyltransferase [Paracoccaceae bacterium]
PGAGGFAGGVVALAAGRATYSRPAGLAMPGSPGLLEGFARLVAGRARGGAAPAARQPVSQIVGRRAFWKHEFAITRDVLDPRPETELLVEVALEEPFETMLDIGTGSGCILLSLLAERPRALGLGTDISAAAIAVARGNAVALGIGARARFLRTDWVQGVKGRFDLVVSNPPYLAESEVASLEPEPRIWEPRGALVSGPSGLEAYRFIAAAAPRLLARGGRIVLEHGPGQGPAIAALISDAGLEVLPPRNDLDGRARALVARAAP